MALPNTQPMDYPQLQACPCWRRWHWEDDVREEAQHWRVREAIRTFLHLLNYVSASRTDDNLGATPQQDGEVEVVVSAPSSSIASGELGPVVVLARSWAVVACSMAFSTP